MAIRTHSEPKHPLSAVQVKMITCWPEWLELWGLATRLDEFLALLHVGFEVDRGAPHWIGERYIEQEWNEEPFERAIFYMMVANGWAYSDHFLPVDNRAYGREWEQYVNPRREIAEKALLILSQKTFALPEDCELLKWGRFYDTKDRVAERLRYLAKPGFLNQFFWFFRTEGTGFYNLPSHIEPDNLKPGLKRIRTFLVYFLDSLLHDRMKNQERRRDLQKYITDIIDCLFAMDRLDLLITYTGGLPREALHHLRQKVYNQDANTNVRDALLNGARGAKELLIIREKRMGVALRKREHGRKRRHEAKQAARASEQLELLEGQA